MRMLTPAVEKLSLPRELERQKSTLEWRATLPS